MTEPVATTPALDPRVAGALTRYRVMAIVTGSFLLLLLTLTAVKYIQEATGDLNLTLANIQGVVGIVHGWIYIVYLLATVHLWFLMHWGFRRLIVMALGGVVPFLSFFLEHRFAVEARTSTAGNLEP